MAIRTTNARPSHGKKPPLALILLLAFLAAAVTLYFVHRSSLPGEASPAPASQPEVPSGQAAPSKHIYSDTVDPRKEVAAGLARASQEHKRLLLDFGGDWCGDCLVLDFYLHQTPNDELLRQNFVLVHVYVGEHIDQNLDVPAKYNVAVSKGVPALAVLDAQGNVLYSQTTGEFSHVRAMDPSSVTEFSDPMEGLDNRVPPPAGEGSGINPVTRRVRTRASTTVRGSVRYGLFWSSVLRHTALRAIEHDCLNVAQSAAYSSIIALFPGLIATAAIVALLPHAAPLRDQFAEFFGRILPGDVVPVLGAYFAPNAGNPQSARAIVIGVLVSIFSASGVIATLMEGFRRAHDLSPDCWSFWQRRRRALILVPLSLIPFSAASLLVVFGQILTEWLGLHLAPSVRPTFSVAAFCLRWTIALAGSVGLIAVIYHLGTPLREPWQRKIPGAAAATVMWFLSTLLFGLYVTRYANYGQVYGSLGAGIALLFWLYIISLSVLCGEECNAELAARKASSGGSSIAH